MSRRAYTALAGITGGLGLASSCVTAWLFMLGLERLEGDLEARMVLGAAGVLMVATELAAFGIAALLPRHTLKALKVQLILFGMVLLAFETVTVYTTQAAMMHTATATGTGAATRITELRASIDTQRQAALDLRTTGAAQGASLNSWNRQLGAATLKQALATEQALLPLARELADLQSTVKPTMHDILGQQGMLWFAVARSLLISGMGLVMFGTAGALLRASREAGAAKGVEATAPLLDVPVATPVPNPVPVEAPVPPGYDKIKAGVINGTVHPSTRGIRQALGGATAAIQAALVRLGDEGVTVRHKQGWALA